MSSSRLFKPSIFVHSNGLCLYRAFSVGNFSVTLVYDCMLNNESNFTLITILIKPLLLIIALPLNKRAIK